MNLVSKIPASCITAGVMFITGRAVATDAPEKEAHVTQIVKDVQLLPFGSSAQPAAINDKVDENTGVKTGEESRSELTFTDFTITRLSANTVFSFNKAGREVQLDNGSILFRVPKNSGGGSIKTHAVTVGITGTTVIFEYSPLGRGQLTVLEGDARLTLVEHPNQSRHVGAGQMLDAKAGATTLSAPVEVDLSEIMRNSPLITDFPPLPSQDLIIAAINDQQAPSSKGSSVPHRKSTAGPSGKSSKGPPIYHGGTVSDDDEVYNNLPPPGQGRWVNPNLYGNSTPRPHGEHGNFNTNTSSNSIPPPPKGTNTTSGGPILHHTGQPTNQSNTTNNNPNGTNLFKGSGRVIKGKTTSTVRATPTPSPTKFLKNRPP